MGQRANNPAARYAFTTDEMPPCVSNDVPSITMRRGFRARISGLRRRAEVAADVEVLDEQPRLAARRAGDVLHLHDVHVAAALHLRGDGAADAIDLIPGERVVGHDLQHDLARAILLVLDRLDGGELGKMR